MKKSIIVLLTLFICSFSTSVYAAGSDDMLRTQTELVRGYIAAMNDVYEAYEILVGALFDKEVADSMRNKIAIMRSNNTESRITENRKETEKFTKELENELSKVQDLSEEQKKAMQQAVIPFFRGNTNMVALLANTAAASAQAIMMIATNPFRALQIKEEFKGIIFVGKNLPEYSRVNNRIMATVSQLLKKDSVGISKQKEAAEKEAIQLLGPE